MKDSAKEKMQSFSAIIYIGYSLIQMGAILDGLEIAFHLPKILSWILLPIVGFMPILNSIVCFLGALYGFGWPWIGAAVFSFPLAIFTAISLLFSVIFGKNRR